MSHKIAPQSTPLSFSSPSSKSFKRRSLQSPFILNDLNGDSEQETSTNLPEEEADQSIDMSYSFSTDDDSIKDNLVVHKRLNDNNNINLNQSNISSENNILASLLQSATDSPKMTHNKRFSIQSLSNFNNINGNPSLTASFRTHNRSRSTASMNYTPINAPPPPISSSLKDPHQRTPPLPENNTFQQSINSPSHSPAPQPFKFNSMIMNNSSENLSIKSQIPSSPQVLPKPSYRRGHRYKHSSVSMNMFQDNQRKASATKHNLPKKYEIPSFKEVRSMITSSQKGKLAICFIQALVVLIAYIAGFHYSNSCLSTLSHILFYDVISNLSSIIVQIMSNFEVWRNSSLKYPFGLGRIEVLFSFALSVSLLFVGLDLFSHIVEELLMQSLVSNEEDLHIEHHNHLHGNIENTTHQLHPVLYEFFILAIIFITILTSHVVNTTTALNSGKKTNNDIKDKENSTPIYSPNMAPNAKRLSSITLKEPMREGLINRFESFLKSKIGFKPNLFHSSTTNLSLIYGCYSLYYPFAQGILQLHSVGNFLSSKDSFKHNHEDESLERKELEATAIETTEWINQISTVVMAILVSIVAWRLIWRLGNILLLTSPSIDIKKTKDNNNEIRIDDIKNNNDVEGLIESNIRQLEVFKNSYTIQEIKIARVNTRVYIVIIRIKMPGASDDEEAKFRFYGMRIVRGLMYQCVKGQLKKGKENNIGNKDDLQNTENVEEERKKSLIDLLNLSTSLEDVEGMDNSGDQFEITIDISRL